MGDQRNYAALDWVLGEIEETLNDARQALEAYVENPKDLTQLRFCITHIHQVRGSLQIVEFHGASLLAEEMELLAQALMSQSVSSISDTQEVLMRALLQLPIYLDHVKVYRDDTARTILPLLNDIRALRKESYLSESNLFTPDLSVLKQLEGRPHPALADPAKVRQVTGKLREMYQFAAASVLRNIKVRDNLEYLEKVFLRLVALTGGTPSAPLWQVSSALIEGLKNESIDLSIAVKGLLRHLARELRLLSEQAPESFGLSPREGLIKNLLYYIASSRAESAQILKTKERFKLHLSDVGRSDKTDGAYGENALDPDAVRSVVTALREELKSIKSNLDAALTSQVLPHELNEILPVVKRVADTLAVLGIRDLRELMLVQAENLADLSQRNSLDEASLMRSAGSIIDVDSKLEAISKAVGRHRDLSNINERSIEIDEAKLAVLNECHIGLEKVKEAIIEYISSQWDIEHLTNIDQLLIDIRGGLDMVPLSRAGAIIGQCTRYISERLIGEREQPSWSSLDALADAMAGIEYYLERLSNDISEEGDNLLKMAEESVAVLGYPVDGSAPEKTETEPAADFASKAEETAFEGNASSDQSVQEEPTQERSFAPTLQTSQASSDSADDIDDEIVEIFIEESQEVRERLNEYLPKWLADVSDEESLTVVRRAFHTLKGSGRMVEAMEIGELAWSIENMLNRIIDHTVSFQTAHGLLVQAVIDILPTMVEAFKGRYVNPEKERADQYSNWAFSLAEGVLPENFALDQQDSSSDDNEEDDYVLLEIFSSEVETHLKTIRNFIAWMDQAAPIYTPPSDDLQRALHTLKGSAKMAQVTPIAQVYEGLEVFAKELVTFQVNLNEDILQLMRDAVTYTESVLAQIESREPVYIAKLDQFLARTAELRELNVGHLVRMKEQDRDGENPVDPRLLSIFMAEEMTLLLDADEVVDAWCAEPSNREAIPGLVKELDTLAVGADHAKLPDMSAIALQLQEMYGFLQLDESKVDGEARENLLKGHAALLDMVDAVAAGQNVQSPPLDVSSQLTAYVDKLRQSAVGSAESEAVENIELVPVSEDVLDSNPPDNVIAIDAGMGAGFAESQDESGNESPGPLIELDSGSESEQSETELGEIHGDTNPLEASGSDTELVDIVPGEDQDSGFQSDMDYVLVEATETENPELQTSDTNLGQSESFGVDDLNFEQDASDLVTSSQDTSDDNYRPEEPLPTFDVSDSTLDSEESLLPSETEPATDSTAASAVGLLDKIDTSSEDFDLDILEVFIEEADELFEELDESIHGWESGENVAAVEEVKRALHTLKGGARLAGMPVLGDLVHDYESYLTGLDAHAADASVFAQVHNYQDRMYKAVAAVKTFLGSGDSVATPDPEASAGIPEASDEAFEAPLLSVEVPTLVVEDDASTSGETQAPLEEQAPSPEADGANILPFVSKPKVETDSPGEPAVLKQLVSRSGGGAAAVAKKSGPQEVVRINSDLLEELVNLAGETSISRSRLEEQVSEFRNSLEEVDSTIERLQEQLRRLDIETEAQVLFRQEQMAVHEESFDPLEMDRYSHLQQLSRSLAESASDLYDLRSDLSNKVKDAETTLLQQSRINTTLQEGLMRSRMVPFSRLVPRLRRIVRQVATELGKKVSFELDNVEGELDRNVLERMVPPFEHMLRNAVDHGIESPEERIAKGKSETGRIVLTLGREGGNVIIRLADDGKGVDLQRVRNKAVERGLMAADAELSDLDVMQFILHAGFSTAENVTQISGRGVGMDVVNAEIKQLGGDVTINSEWGKGTEFIVHLPFTLSVNRALMVEIGKDHYAIPLNSIEGIVRVSPFELDHYYNNPETEFEYAKEKFKVRYLGSLLYTGREARLEGHILPLPVILVRSAQHTMALQVDSLMGSREIVVKSLGSQFSSVQGLSGATIMGDGSVVVILDPHALVRQEIARSDLLIGAASKAQLELGSDSAESSAEAEAVPTIMVVDDSVTVRKVTTRFLEREGYNVITAKDGVDALGVLQDEMPDLMLLDIEMPRMDGFEVAKNIRSSQSLKHLPIIMITSRTGDKHRDHALSLGVNRYMGKPYQEEALLESIRELTNDAKSTAH